MKYQCRKGIVRVQICGEYYLIPTREASEICPTITRLPLLSAAIWEEVEKGNNTDKLRFAFQTLTHKPEEEIQARIDGILEDLFQRGYLVEAGESVG